jgi:hypothetical protein
MVKQAARGIDLQFRGRVDGYLVLMFHFMIVPRVSCEGKGRRVGCSLQFLPSTEQELLDRELTFVEPRANSLHSQCQRCTQTTDRKTYDHEIKCNHRKTLCIIRLSISSDVVNYEACSDDDRHLEEIYRG